MFDEELGDDTREAMAKKLFSYRAQLRPGERLIHELKVPGPYFCTGLIGQAAHLTSQYSIFINDRSFVLWELWEQDHITIWRLLKMKNGGVFWPDFYVHGECHKVQEKHFKKPF